ncbi:peptidyl-prolyl cis-trans isomerase NIMA-interacting 1 [Cryptococcus wingfieldii CBS 7118]|uniref:Peptidyl-prolyl cis-trans isomerase n=1 Tax=Cryptococcus wingfieldii CBS 7118 TaxID=1295528 RepID=A0A1E3K242_9TREE|nr:peptidyl-prolyl cis-trans isomerase NIMA-interacting 1 [Cryptococcus wingfieldii CBS 7118]ODO07238.1 peptidyl-prolyl cis-trans isomerase NIMA-interacting 1 [Cryptococcus wingfieldii CBS 7118]
MSSTGWEVRFSNSRQLPYFYHAQQATSTWEPPADLTPEQIQQLPGASQYLNPQTKPPGGKDGQARASHILAKHSGSRRPASWRSDNITISSAEAQSIIEKHVAYLKSLPKEHLAREFAKIASTESDCSSAKKGGDLGWFGRGQMQKPFEDNTFSTPIGELSDIVKTDSGVHVILRTG